MMTDESIEKYEQAGFKRWTKNQMDRLYVNANVLGLECTYYKTGNVHSANFNGEDISNSEAYRMKAAKTYIDIKDGKLHADRKDFEEAAEALIASIA